MTTRSQISQSRTNSILGTHAPKERKVRNLLPTNCNFDNRKGSNAGALRQSKNRAIFDGLQTEHSIISVNTSGNPGRDGYVIDHTQNLVTLEETDKLSRGWTSAAGGPTASHAGNMTYTSLRNMNL